MFEDLFIVDNPLVFTETGQEEVFTKVDSLHF